MREPSAYFPSLGSINQRATPLSASPLYHLRLCSHTVHRSGLSPVSRSGNVWILQLIEASTRERRWEVLQMAYIFLVFRRTDRSELTQTEHVVSLEETRGLVSLVGRSLSFSAYGETFMLRCPAHDSSFMRVSWSERGSKNTVSPWRSAVCLRALVVRFRWTV